MYTFFEKIVGISIILSTNISAPLSSTYGGLGALQAPCLEHFGPPSEGPHAMNVQKHPKKLRFFGSFGRFWVC